VKIRLSLLLLLITSSAFATSRVEIRDGRFYVDGQPFYIRGVGYAPWRPHQKPGVSYTATNYRWTKMDFERMKAANFNTVRTWDALEAEDLALAKANQLMVLQGIWLDPKQDFSDSHNQQSAIAQVRSIAERSKDHDNILGYLIMTEPFPQAVLESGKEATEQFFRRLKRALQEVDPRPVSMDSWPPLGFMNHDDYDFATFNLFGFWPKSLVHAMGLAGMTRWFVDHHAAQKPLIVGETGGYSVSKASQTAAGGFGGLQEYDQSVKSLESLRASLEGHASGTILVSWIDTWHYPQDPDTHDDEPWEWNGILGIETDSKKDMNGIPRQIYRDVSAYNHLIPIEPKTNHYYPVEEPVSIQVNTSDKVTHVRYGLNHSDWKYLDGSGKGWFQGFLKLPKLARRRQTLLLQALDKKETVLASKEVSFLAHIKGERITVEPRSAIKGKNASEFVARVENSLRLPIRQRRVHFGCFDPVSFGERMGSAVTDTSGQVVFSCSPMSPAPRQYLFVAAGTDSDDRVRTSDLRIFKLAQ
jgi:hypothetical protein